MSSISQNLLQVQQKIRQAMQAARRDPHNISLVAVSKTRTPAEVQLAFDAGQRDFAENYLQDAERRMQQLEHQAVWHYIGPVQSNKTRIIAARFSWVHSIDRLKIAQRLNDQRPDFLAPLNVCIQVNTSNESTKSGITPDTLFSIVDAVRQLPNLKLRGLMTIPANEQDLDKQRIPFKKLKQLLKEINETGIKLDTLSMGMSNDFEAAIMEGATIVRIGTAIFGKREQDRTIKQ